MCVLEQVSDRTDEQHVDAGLEPPAQPQCVLSLHQGAHAMNNLLIAE